MGLFRLIRILLPILYFIAPIYVNGQNVAVKSANDFQPAPLILSKIAIDNQHHFVQQVGQYAVDENLNRFGSIDAGFEGFSLPVLFTKKGLIFLQQQQSEPTHQEVERLMKKGLSEQEIEKQRKSEKAVITMEWVGANDQATVVYLNELPGKHTYGRLPNQASGFSRLMYKDIYPGIDVVFELKQDAAVGFEYSLIVKPGANLADVKMKFGGDLKQVELKKDGSLKLDGALQDLFQSSPFSYTMADEIGNDFVVEKKNKEKLIKSGFALNGDVVQFRLFEKYDSTKVLIIDPFVTATVDLIGTNAGKAKDVDFDYAGNVYVTGGGDGNTHQLSKYNAAGILQWTFSGSLTNPAWSFGTYYGGWVVDKNSGSVYLGQGFSPGFRIIRINTLGVYDNYITSANPAFMENWKMVWRCNNGTPQIMIAGGGINSNINLGILTPPDVTITATNVTGVPYAGGVGFAQDIADLVIDPHNNDMYTIFASLFGAPALNNKVYKHLPPYSAATIGWSVPSGYFNLEEASNRPYMAGALEENSINALAINSSYLFLWDGRHLKAFNKATGAAVGTPLDYTLGVDLMTGGIVVNECNTLFVGGALGTIKVFQFDGVAFNDDAQPDIHLNTFNTRSVYDLAYDDSRNLLYASGDGFVASVDISAYTCAQLTYTLTATPNCLNSSATMQLTPAAPLGSVVTFELYLGSNLVDRNETGLFTALLPNTSYTVKAFVNQVCSGVQTLATFTMPNPALAHLIVSPTCGNTNGEIILNATGGVLPYTYSIDGVQFSSAASFNQLPGGLYHVVVKDGNGCQTTREINLINTDGPVISETHINALCGLNNGVINLAATGAAPFSFSVDSVHFSSNQVFGGLAAGAYPATVIDQNGCSNKLVVEIVGLGGASLLAAPTHATCAQQNGQIIVQANGGTAPLQYSINGLQYFNSGSFGSLLPGDYRVYVKDGNGCISDTLLQIQNLSGPALTATVTATSCNNFNGTITAIVNGGTLPYQFSIDGVNFQTSSYFPALPAGMFLLTVRDATGCSSSINVTITANGAPVLTLATTVSSCASSTGTITASVTGGAAPYSYSLTGLTYQASNVFSALAPGNYVVWVRDASGCMAAMTATISVLAGPSLSLNITPAGCADNEGVIVANGTGGVAPLQYRLNTGAFQLSNTFSGLSAGQYQVTVRAANGCMVSSNVTVANSTGLQISAGAVSANCNVNNGVINLNGSGGLLPYTYNLNNGAYQPDGLFSGLAPGNYVAKIKDANGCIRIANLTIGLVGVPAISTSQVNTNCNGSNGSITIAGTGGLSPYLFSINGADYQNVGAFTHLSSGSYTAYLKDSTGCQVTQSIVLTNVGAGPAPDFVSVLVDPSNCGTDDGKIDTDADGGNNPLRYSIDGVNFQSGSAFNHLFAGTYTITVRDRDGCTNSVTVVVPNNNGAAIDAVTTTSTCAVPTGTITVTASGSPGPFLYSINGVVYQVSNVFTALPAGTYTVWVDDGTECITTKQVVILNSDGPSVTATVTNAYCSSNNGTITLNGTGIATLTYNVNGGLFQVSNSFPNLFPGNYIVTVKDGNGCINNRIVTVGDLAAPTANFVIKAANCNSDNGEVRILTAGGLWPFQYSLNGISFQTDSIFQNLAPGSYTVTILDANSCFSRINFTVGSVAMPVVTGAASPTNCGAATGQIFAVGSGGVGPYQYSIDGVIYQSLNTFTGLTPGGYTLFVKDANGCINQTGVNVIALKAPIVNAVSTSAGCNNDQGTVTIAVAGAGAPFEYSLNGVDFQFNNQFSGLSAGIYNVVVKNNTGCVAPSRVSVLAQAVPTLTANVSVANCLEGSGVINAFGIGGSGLLEYSIDGVNFQSSSLFSGLANGDYQVEVRDAAGCNSATMVTVYNFPSIQLNVDVQRVCGSNAVVIASANGGSGTLYYSLDGAQYFDNGVFNEVLDGVYNLVVQDEMGCQNSMQVTVAPMPTNPRTWLGFNTNWEDAVNWCGGVPDILTDVIIPGGLSNYPFIQNQTASCKNITIEPGAGVELSDGVIRISGNIVNLGMLNAKAGTIALLGNAEQQIAGTTFFEHTIRELVIGNVSAAGVVVLPNLNDTLKISRKLAFGYASAVFTTSNQVVLLSNDTATASLGIIEEELDGSPKATINGKIIVERYYPSKRAWRFITAPIKNDAVAPTINAAWQEGANPPSITGVANPNPSPTYGTHITGPWSAPTAYSAVVTASGFDQSPQNNSSMKYYNGLLNNYLPVNNTLTNKVTSKQGFLLFVRGDRSYDISTTTNFTVPSATTLRVSGNVNLGKISIPADTGFQVIGNPYPSAIRFDDAMFNDNSAIMRNQSFWLWDPLRGAAKASPTNVGGWVPVVYVGGGNYISTYNPNLSVVNIDSAHAFPIDGSIQSGSAFIIDNLPTAIGSFVLHESSKIDGSNNNSFRAANVPMGYMMVNLFKTDANKKATYWADGTAVVLKNEYDNAVKENEDVRKFFGSVENLGIRSGGNSLAIEKRFNFIAGDTLHLETVKLKAGSYLFEVFFKDSDCEGLDIYFEDKFTGLQTQLQVNEHSLIHVNIVNEPGSYAADRFTIVFKPTAVLPVQWISFIAQPNSEGVLLNWTIGQQLNVRNYEVERSQDGIHFNVIGTVITHSSERQNLFQDDSPLFGINYYRIRVVDSDGRIQYSVVRKVIFQDKLSEIRIVNNPVTSTVIEIAFKQINLGTYQWYLYSESGQLIQQDRITHQQGSARYRLPLQRKYAAGTYRLVIEKEGVIIGQFNLMIGW